MIESIVLLLFPILFGLAVVAMSVIRFRRYIGLFKVFAGLAAAIMSAGLATFFISLIVFLVSSNPPEVGALAGTFLILAATPFWLLSLLTKMRSPVWPDACAALLLFTWLAFLLPVLHALVFAPTHGLDLDLHHVTPLPPTTMDGWN